MVDFGSLLVWDKLEQEFPSGIWDYFKQPNWLGLTNNFFANPNFDPDRLLATWFKLRETPEKPAASQKPKGKLPPKKPEVRQEQEDSDEEDYDLDELMANRVLDDVYHFEAEKSGNGGHSARKLPYLPQTSVRDCETAIRKCKEALDVCQSEGKGGRQVQMEVEKLCKEIRIEENRQRFFEKLFTAYKSGQLELPDVGHLLVRGQATEHIIFATLTYASKWAVIFAVMERARVLTIEKAGTVDQLLVEAQKRLDSIRRVGDGKLLERTKVVGMTTTGAAKNRDLLQMMKSKIGKVLLRASASF